jgi:hypothetical protein
MAHTIEVTKKEQVVVKYLQARCGVRYWEDATVNGVEDEDGSRIPFRDGDNWCPKIELETGKIVDWPQGTTAHIHYKVCDDGDYKLLDECGNVVVHIDEYVPAIMSPGDSCKCGDYVVMDVDAAGLVQKWVVTFKGFDFDLSD